ncbi:PREDICTED: protein TAPT1 homolog isoform X3 [Vollenhovia emeryi]|uniref:protein TAPT1 homolog isoform X3 n=1 Tax=Vollenhovia emeryi TaxID=411798 RepID=UPI0005F4DF70|nr:PREDICTED: protein TAPT1 homolog isoform X3 [Vollenhovia emeryi]
MEHKLLRIYICNLFSECVYLLRRGIVDAIFKDGINEGLSAGTRRGEILREAGEGLLVHENSSGGGELHGVWVPSVRRLLPLRVYLFTAAIRNGFVGGDNEAFTTLPEERERAREKHGEILESSRSVRFVEGNRGGRLLGGYLEVGDRLFSAFGQDTIDALLWTATEPRSRSNSTRTKHFGTLPHLLFAVAYVLLHSILVLFQATTLNVAINSSNKALLTIMMSNNFVELKGSVFKKFDKNNLFQLSCADVRERFHLIMLLLAVSLQTMKEYAWHSDRLAVLLPDCVLLLLAEVLVDWVKHAFITRFNELPSTVYRDYTVSLAYDMAQTRRETAFSDPSDLVARRMGFIPLPLGVAMARVLCTTLTPSARPANIILLLLAYLILVSLRILNSLIILGKACDIMSSHTQPDKDDVPAKFPSKNRANSVDMKNPNLGTAIFSNSAVSLNNVCLNEAFLEPDEAQKSEKLQCNFDELTNVTKTVLRTGSEPLLSQ